MLLEERRAGSRMAEKEPRNRAPVRCCGDAGRIRCIGVHMACITSGGRLSKRIMFRGE